MPHGCCRTCISNARATRRQLHQRLALHFRLRHLPTSRSPTRWHVRHLGRLFRYGSTTQHCCHASSTPSAMPASGRRSFVTALPLQSASGRRSPYYLLLTAVLKATSCAQPARALRMHAWVRLHLNRSVSPTLYDHPCLALFGLEPLQLCTCPVHSRCVLHVRRRDTPIQLLSIHREQLGMGFKQLLSSYPTTFATWSVGVLTDGWIGPTLQYVRARATKELTGQQPRGSHNLHTTQLATIWR